MQLVHGSFDGAFRAGSQKASFGAIVCATVVIQERVSIFPLYLAAQLCEGFSAYEAELRGAHHVAAAIDSLVRAAAGLVGCSM